MLLEYRQFSPVVKLIPSGASLKDHDLFKTSTWRGELLRRLRQSPCAYGSHLSIQPLFVNPLLVPAMNFPAPLQILWRGKRLNSFNRVFKDLFQSRVYKIGLRMDFTRPNRDGKIAVVGLESMHGHILRWVNRGHSMKDFLNAVERITKRNLRLCPFDRWLSGRNP